MAHRVDVGLDYEFFESHRLTLDEIHDALNILDTLIVAMTLRFFGVGQSVGKSSEVLLAQGKALIQRLQVTNLLQPGPTNERPGG